MTWIDDIKLVGGYEVLDLTAERSKHLYIECPIERHPCDPNGALERLHCWSCHKPLDAHNPIKQVVRK